MGKVFLEVGGAWEQPQASHTLGAKAGPGGGHSWGFPANPVFGLVLGTVPASKSWPGDQKERGPCGHHLFPICRKEY